MAKQNQAKAPEPTKDNTISPQEPVVIYKETLSENNLVDEKEQISLTETASVPAQINENHNPYSNASIVEDGEKSNELLGQTKSEELAPHFDNPVIPEIIQPTIQDEPIKPTLTDQVVYQDFSQASTVQVENDNGVTVNLSGTAAKILKKLDAKTKIVG